MTKRILWEPKCMIFSFEKNVNIYFFNNKNASYRKNCTFYFISEVAPIGGYSSVKGDQFYFSNF